MDCVVAIASRNDGAGCASFDGEFSDRSQSYAGKGGLKVNW